MGQDGIDQAVFHRFRRRQEAVTLGIALDLLKGLTRMMRHQFIHTPFHFQNLTGVDFNIRRLTLIAAQRLVNHHAGVRQTETLAFRPGGQQEGAH